MDFLESDEIVLLDKSLSLPSIKKKMFKPIWTNFCDLQEVQCGKYIKITYIY